MIFKLFRTLLLYLSSMLWVPAVFAASKESSAVQTNKEIEQKECSLPTPLSEADELVITPTSNTKSKRKLSITDLFNEASYEPDPKHSMTFEEFLYSCKEEEEKAKSDVKPSPTATGQELPLHPFASATSSTTKPEIEIPDSLIKEKKAKEKKEKCIKITLCTLGTSTFVGVIVIAFILGFS